jgi:hypothetical protein
LSFVCAIRISDTIILFPDNKSTRKKERKKKAPLFSEEELFVLREKAFTAAS